MKHTQKNLAFQMLFSMLLLFSFFSATAQTEKKVSNKFYLQLAAGPVTQESGNAEISLQAIFKNKWSSTLSYQDISMKHRNIPANYKPATSTTYLMGIPIFSSEEVEPMNMSIISLSAGRCFDVSKKSWVTTEAGFSYVKGGKASFTPTPVTNDSYDYWLISGSSSSSNYKMTIENKTTVGAMLKADINWALAPYIGLGAGLFTNFNSIQSPIGFQVKLMIGKVR